MTLGNSSFKYWLIPLLLAFIYGSGPAALLWTTLHFSWSAAALSLVMLIYPLFSLYHKLRLKLETAEKLKGMLAALLLSALFTSLHYDAMHPKLLGIMWLHVGAVWLLTTSLSKLGLSRTQLKEGNTLPDFVFEDVYGNPVTRKSIGEGPILFYFFRGNWCPFCSAQIAALMQDYQKILEEGIRLAFVSSQPHQDMQELANKYGLDSLYLVDKGFAFSKRYSLIDRGGVPLGLSKFGEDTLLPTLLFLDHRNKVQLLAQTDHLRLRPDPSAVLDKVKRLGKNIYLEEKVAERTKELELEREKAEQLILNILPEHTAIELKLHGKTQARYYESATLLFSDFVGFTRTSSEVEPQLLVDTLNHYFERYDAIVTELGLEKIKTIGDAYMVAAGIPNKDPDHALKICQLAVRMLAVGEQLRSNKSICHFDCRIGIHSGPVMTGVVGVKKFCYDIWGDTVNLAARMESLSEPGKINLSASTCAFVKEHALVEPRGFIEVKNHQPQEMFFLKKLHQI